MTVDLSHSSLRFLSGSPSSPWAHRGLVCVSGHHLSLKVVVLTYIPLLHFWRKINSISSVVFIFWDEISHSMRFERGLRTVGLQTPQISNAALFPVVPVTCPQDRLRALRKSASIKPGAQKNLFGWFQPKMSLKSRMLDIIFMWNYSVFLQSSLLWKCKLRTDAEKVNDLFLCIPNITFIHRLLTGLWFVIYNEISKMNKRI